MIVTYLILSFIVLLTQISNNPVFYLFKQLGHGS